MIKVFTLAAAGFLISLWLLMGAIIFTTTVIGGTWSVQFGQTTYSWSLTEHVAPVTGRPYSAR